MLTAFGKELRKVRIDKGELIKNMADKLGISPSYLSSIETGARAIPENMIDKITEIYSLNSTDRQTLINAQDASAREVTIDLSNEDENRREFAVTMARKFNSFTEEDLDEIKKIFEKYNEVR